MGVCRSKCARVLVVDDDVRFGADAVRRLAAAGFETRFHNGPCGALQAIRDMRCDLVLLDVSMQKLDALVVIRMIGDSIGMGRVPVLFWSDMDPQRLDLLATLRGARGFLPKTVGDEELIAKLRGALV